MERNNNEINDTNNYNSTSNTTTSHNNHNDQLIPNFSLTHPLVLSAATNTATALDLNIHPNLDQHSHIIISDIHSDVGAQPSESAPEHDDVDMEDTNETIVTRRNGNLFTSPSSSVVVPSSVDISLTRKQLIERERQARLERERAKLKQHFAMNRVREEEAQAFEEADIVRIGSDDMDNYDDDPESSDSSFSVDEILLMENVDHNPDAILQEELDTNHVDHHILDLNSSVVNEELNVILPSTAIRNELVVVGDVLDTYSPDISHPPQLQLGYTMERFLKERNPSPNAILGVLDSAIHTSHDPEPDPHPSYPDDNDIHIEQDLRVVSQLSVISNENMSLENHRPASDVSSPTRIDLESRQFGREYLDNHPISPYYPRLARLTEAEAFDLHDIDYASVGNFPPRSLRDEQHLPEIRSNASNLSHVTQTTLHESESSTPSRSSSLHTIERIEEGIPSELSNNDEQFDPKCTELVSTEIESKEHETQNGQDVDDTNEHSESSSDRKLPAVPVNEVHDVQQTNVSDGKTAEGTKVIISTSISPAFGLQNRQIRPGFGEAPQHYKRSENVHRRAQTTPNFASFVDDFDYCKYNDGSVESGSPIRKSVQHITSENGTYSKNYGSTINNCNLQNNHIDIEEMEALMKKDKLRRDMSYDEMVDSIFSSVRSMSTDDIQAEIDECEAYASKGAIDRALSGRFQALSVTLVLEVPVFLIIAGGSDRLCGLIGQVKYQLLLAFLPMSTSIGGHCGIQASELATRAVSHLHVSKKNYLIWLYQELQVAMILGCVVGLVVGSIALYATFMLGQFDMNFAFLIFMANFVNIFSAGLTGTLAPLISTYICHRDSMKWRGALQTAFHDFVGSFMMIVCSYHLLILLHPWKKE